MVSNTQCVGAPHNGNQSACSITWKYTANEKKYNFLLNPLLSLSELRLLNRLVMTGVSLDFTDSTWSWQEALWESNGEQSGIESFKQCATLSNSRCHGHSWPARYGPSHWFFPRRPHPAVRLSFWCSAHRAPWWRPSARPTRCQQQRWRSRWRQRKGSPRSPESGDISSGAGCPPHPADGPACQEVSHTPSGPHLSDTHQERLIIQYKTFSSYIEITGCCCYSKQLTTNRLAGVTLFRLLSHLGLD